MRRNQTLLSKALSGLYVYYKNNGGFSNDDAIWKLCLDILENHKTNSQLQMKALKITYCLAIAKSPQKSILKRFLSILGSTEGASKVVSYASRLCVAYCMRFDGPSTLILTPK